MCFLSQGRCLFIDVRNLIMQILILYRMVLLQSIYIQYFEDPVKMEQAKVQPMKIQFYTLDLNIF